MNYGIELKTIMRIAQINKIIHFLMIAIFLLAFVGGYYSRKNNQPLQKKKLRILLTILSFFPISPIAGGLISMPIRFSLSIGANDYYYGLRSMGGNLSIISFAILYCIIWYTRRDPRQQTIFAE